MLVHYQYLLAVIQNLEGWLYIFEFLINGFSPQSISFSSSTWQASLTFLGILMQNLWVRFQHLALTFYIVRSCLMRVSGTHNSKSVSSAILFPTAYSALITGYSYLISFNGVLDVFQISPFNEKFLRFCHLPHVFIDVLDSDVHIIAANNIDIFLVVNDLLQYMISVSIIIYPCIYALSNYVS